ncbi:MAG: four helix bundle protein [Bacilli bacterium]|jgi:hypothetical protein
MNKKKGKQIELPIYKESYELLLLSFKLIKDLTREYKYTLGEKIKNEITDLLMDVYRANKVKVKGLKLKYVSLAIEKIEVIRLLFRLLFDLKQISENHHVSVSCKIENVRRQLIGWEIFLKK